MLWTGLFLGVFGLGLLVIFARNIYVVGCFSLLVVLVGIGIGIGIGLVSMVGIMLSIYSIGLYLGLWLVYLRV